MSIIFKKPTRRVTVERTAGGKQIISGPFYAGHRSIKFVELYGTLNSLSANLSDEIIDWEIPDGHAAELVGVGIIPDYDPSDGSSNLLETEIGYDDKLTGIKFLTNHNGMNALPYGDRASKRPMFRFDEPMRRGSLTVKYSEGQTIQIVITAGSTAISRTVYARALVYLYEKGDCERVFGVPISRLNTVTGGVSQELPVMYFADYALLESATGGNAKWTDLYSKTLKDFEHLNLTKLGVKPHDNADALKVYDSRLKKEWPEYEPYWTITRVANMLPFGDDDDYQGPRDLPAVLKNHTFTHTTLKIQIRDTGTAIPANGVAVQLYGVYRRVK